jgi:hypothetical protein
MIFLILGELNLNFRLLCARFFAFFEFFLDRHSLSEVCCGYFSEMARNKVLEDLLNDDLAQVRGITEKAMFGGRAWLLHGNLLCGARDDGMLVRLGKGNDTWALAIPGIGPMISRGRPMHGWVRAAPEVYENDGLRRKLLKAALDFNRTLPKK